MKILIIFTILSIINVIFSTIRSLTTIKSGKTVASLVNAGYFAFYTIMLIYTVANFPLWQKVAVTFGCNLIGVYAVKLIEEKVRKDKLWKIEATISKEDKDRLIEALANTNISFNYIESIGEYTIFNIFCKDKKESADVKGMLGLFKVRYFVSETKTL